MALDTIPKQEGGKLKAVASGTLPSGVPVVVNADGTVSVVAETNVTQALGSSTVFETGNTQDTSCAFDSVNNKIVVAYKDGGNSSYGTAVVGTISGTSVSFGTPVVFHNTSGIEFTTSVFDDTNDKIIITYAGASSYATSVVGTVSGTSISFGTPVVVASTYSDKPKSTFDTANAKLIVVSDESNNSDRGVVYVGTVSGTSISFGSANQFVASSDKVNVAYDAGTGNIVAVSSDDAYVGTVSGTSVTFQSAVTIPSLSGTPIEIEMIGDGNGKVFFAYIEDLGGGNQNGQGIIGTLTGTSISFGAEAVFESNNVIKVDVSYDSNAQKFVVIYYFNSASGQLKPATVSGSTITFEDRVEFDSGQAEHLSTTFDSNSNEVFIAYRDNGNSAQGTGIVFQNASTTSNLTAENYIGMSGGAIEVSSQDAALGSEVVFESADTRMEVGQSAVFDNNSNKVVFVYRDVGNSGYGTAVVGTVSGTSISFGTPVVFESANTEYVSATFDSTNNKVVVVYSDRGNLDYGTAVVGTVSGTSISFGSPVVFESADSEFSVATFDSNSGKVVVAYHDNGNSSYGTAVVGTVSGASISFGTPVVFEAADTRDISATFDSTSNKVIIAYKDVGNSNHGTAIVGAVSGTSISFGSAAVYEAAEASFNSVEFDPVNNKVVVAYQDSGNSGYGTAVVGTVSGTSISFGSAVVFNASSTQYPVAVFDNNAGKTIITYEDSGDGSKGKYSVGTVSDTSITFDTAVVYSDGVGFLSTTYDSNSKKVVNGFRDSSNGYGTGIVIQPAFTDITRGSVADGDAATVDIIGTISSNQVSLTPGQQYYVQTDGTIGTTPADPSVLAGTAVSATKMVVKT